MSDNPDSTPPAALKRDAKGRILPGQSLNPGGLPKGLGEVKDLARRHTKEAVMTLVEIMGDKLQPAPARVGAAVALLDRGWGKPTQAVEHSGPAGGPIRLTWGDGSE